jgi:protein SCO1
MTNLARNSLLAFPILAVGALIFTQAVGNVGPTGATISLSKLARSVSTASSTTELFTEDYSLYDLGSSWKDQTGATRTLASLKGKPRLIAFVYTGCAMTCPLIIQQMKQVEQLVGDDVGYVLVSLDPDNDLPGVLSMFAKQHFLSPDRWTLLTGTAEDVRDMAAVLGVRYNRISGTELAHSNETVLVDAEGAVRSQNMGLETVPAMVDAIRALTK